MKKIVLVLLLGLQMSVFADESSQYTVQTPITTPQNIMFENCSKIFSLSQEKLFLITLGAISANRFSIDEIQTSSGYILFTANKKKYLATVAAVDSNHSILKITPANNIYNFPPGILLNIYRYIDLNIKEAVK